ncbi:MAG: hypothetical protein JWQ02_121, partial [Capsulimonas sp.]|nr:hypothetical protein [Capsulimonas sp.]
GQPGPGMREFLMLIPGVSLLMRR